MTVGVVSTLIAASGLLAVWVTAIRTPLQIAGGLWLAASFMLLLLVRHASEEGALLQEEFDTRLFRIPWRPLRPHLPDVDIARWARRCRRPDDMLRNWYFDVRGILWPYDALACQCENLAWDSRLRRQYGLALYITPAAWAVVIVLIGLAANTSLRDSVFNWFLPSAGATMYALQTGHGHRSVAATRDRLMSDVDRELQHASVARIDDPALVDFCRCVQDDILTTRKAGRVPNWFYRLSRPQNEVDMQAIADSLRERL
jgi:hypothetical protein